MRRLQSETITLGAKSWEVRPLTVAQVQAIEPHLFGAAQGGATNVAAAVSILRVALARDHAEAAAALDDIEAGAGEIAAAMAQVLRLGGFLQNGDVNSGEAEAGRGLGSTGPRSTPA